MQWIGAMGTAAAVIAVVSVTSLSGESHTDVRSQEGAAELVARPAVLAVEQGGARASKPAAAQEEGRVPAAESKKATLAPHEVEPAYAYAVEGVVLDGQDLPLAGAYVFVGTPDQVLNDFGQVDEDGAFRVEWRGHAPRMEAVLWVFKRGMAESGARVLDLRAGRTERVSVAVSRLELADVQRMKKEAMERYAAVGAGEKDEALRNELVRELASLKSSVTGMEARVPGVHIGCKPTPESLRFNWPTAGWMRRLEEANVALQSKEKGAALQAKERALAALGYAGPAGPSRRVQSVAHVAGTVRDAHGAPVGVAMLVLDGRRVLGRAAEDGSFDIAVPIGAKHVLAAGGGDHGRAERALDLTEVEAGERIEWDPALDRGRELRGRLVGPSGEPLDDWVVELEGLGHDRWNDLTETEGGEFAVPNVPAALARVLVRRRGAPPIPARVFENVAAGPGEVELALVAGDLAAGGLRLVLVGATGGAVNGATVFAQHVASGRGLWMRGGAEGLYELDDLPAGAYRVWAGHFSSGFVDAGRASVEADQVSDLGRVALPATGRVSWSGVEEPGRELYYRLFRVGRHVDALVAESLLTEPFDESLPAGRYALVVAAQKDFVMPARVFELEPGAHEELVLAPGRAGRVTLRLPAGAAVSEAEDASDELFVWGVLAEGSDTVLAGSRAEPASLVDVFLPPGEYRARVVRGTERTETAFTVSEGGALVVEL